jgi:hypothetical protein
LGITDVVNTDWRWIYDQTIPNYKLWYPGRPYPANNGSCKIFTCGFMAHTHGGKWFDYHVKTLPSSGLIYYIDGKMNV